MRIQFSTRKTALHISKMIRTFPKRLWPLTSWNIFFFSAAILLCVGASAIVIQHIHNTARQSPTTSKSTTSELPTSHLLINPTTPSENTTPSTSPSSSGATATKPSTPTASVPSATVPPVNVCDDGATNDATARYNLAQGYLEIDGYITAHVDSDAAAIEATPTSQTVEANAFSDLNSVISEANSQFAQSYNEYVGERHQYGCTVTVSAPASMPVCTGTVADCIASINANEPTAPTW